MLTDWNAPVRVYRLELTSPSQPPLVACQITFTQTDYLAISDRDGIALLSLFGRLPGRLI